MKSRSKKTNLKQFENPLFIWLSLSVNNGSGLYKLYSNSLWGSNRQTWRQQLESWLCEQDSTFSSIAQMKQQHHWIFPETLKLHKKCPYSEFFLSVIPRIWTDYGEILRISRYSVRMWQNMDLKNSEYGHFSRSVRRALRNLDMLLHLLYILAGRVKRSSIFSYKNKFYAKYCSLNTITSTWYAGVY